MRIAFAVALAFIQISFAVKGDNVFRGARWIGKAGNVSPAFAKTFDLREGVVSAELAVTGVGYYEARINGKKVGEKVLDPTPTDYRKRVYYSKYDVADLLDRGANEICLLLGNGLFNVQCDDAWKFAQAPWRDFPRGIAVLTVTYADKTTMRLVTDGSWRVTPSPVLFNDFREGEIIRAEPMSPKSPGFAEEVPGPAGNLTEELHPAAKITREIVARSVEPWPDGAMVYDIGCNLAGWARIRFKGLKKGEVVTIRYDERHPREGKRHIDQHVKSVASPSACPQINPSTAGFQTDRFISAGGGDEVYEPRFTYNGFRYVIVTGASNMPERESVVGCQIRTAFPKTGSFTCSDPTFNRLVAATELAYEGSFANGYPMDCPHREKNGWTGDAAMIVEFSQYAYGSAGNAAAYRSWIRTMIDQQTTNGCIPAIVPTCGWGLNEFASSHGPAWGWALTTIPLTVYSFRGDRDFLEEAYPGMVKYVRKLVSEFKDGLCVQGLGDWCAVKIDNPEKYWLPRVPVALSSTAFAYRTMLDLVQSATALGRADDAREFQRRADEIKAAFNRKFYKGNGIYGQGLPYAQAVSLEFGLVPESEREAAQRQLVSAVHAEGDKIDFGMLGTRVVFRALTDAGAIDLAWRLIMRNEYPGFSNFLENGATTLWETFNGDSSRNHVMFGDFAAWAYAFIVGVRPIEPGFRRFLVQPVIPSALTWARARVNTPQGDISAGWKKDDCGYSYELDVPTNTEAIVRLPDGNEHIVGAGRQTFSWKTLEPAYVESAFPRTERASSTTRLRAELVTAQNRASWIDVNLKRTFAALSDGGFVKERVSKRQLLRDRSLAFAERSLERNDATGLGFAERALNDAAVLDGLLKEELALQGMAPSEKDSAVVLNVRDFGAEGDGISDDAPSFVRAAAAVRRLGGRPSRLRIPAGTYHMGSIQRSEAFTDSFGEYNCHSGTLEAQALFAGLENCSIEGEGPEKTFVRCGVYDAAQLALVNCRNVRLSGIEVSLEQTPFIEGTIDRFDFKTGECELTLKPGSLAPDHFGWQEPGESFGFLFDANGSLLQEGRLLPWNVRSGTKAIGGARWRIVFNREDGPWYWDRFVRNIRPGLTLVLPNRRNAFGGVFARFCSFCTFENVWVRNSRASAFCTVRSRAISFVRCRDFPREGFSLASNADGCFCEPGTFVYQCVFDSMGDDGLNTLIRGVTAARGEEQTEVVASDIGLGRGKDMMVFAHPHTAQYLANMRLSQTDALVRRAGGWSRTSRFLRTVPDSCIGAYMYNPDRVGIGTIVSSCVFRNGRLAGNVVQTSASLFENNVYENFHEGIRIGALGDYKEGPPPYNVLVKECRFMRLEKGLTAWIRMCDEAKKKWFEIKCAPIRGVDVRNNAFGDVAGAALDFKNSGDCYFSCNSFTNVATRSCFALCEDMRTRD